MTATPICRCVCHHGASLLQLQPRSVLQLLRFNGPRTQRYGSSLRFGVDYSCPPAQTLLCIGVVSCRTVSLADKRGRFRQNHPSLVRRKR